VRLWIRGISMWNYERHLQSHSVDKSFVCCTCGKSFVCNKEIRRHGRMVSNERRHSCPLCDGTFEDQQQLRDRLGVHIGAQDHKYGHCHNQFRSKSALNRHTMSHLADLCTCITCWRADIQFQCISEGAPCTSW
jgi:KRAB domain-containing zinc finger protein